MRLLKTMGLCLVAALALAVVAAGSASAASEPALYQCGAAAKNATTKKYEGKYTDKKCSKVATAKEIEEGKTNKYEFEEWNKGSATSKTGKKGKVKKFKSKGKPSANLEVPGVGGVACKEVTDKGEFTGPKTAGDIEAVFKGCQISTEPCENGAAGEIKANKLKGSVGYANEAKHEIGIDLSAETGTINAEFHCGKEGTIKLSMRVQGSVVGLVTSPANKWTKEATIDFEQRAGKQDLQNLEGLPKDVLLTAYCKSKLVCEPEGEIESGEETEGTGSGEELYLKAFGQPYVP
jgi:hypothetical protein